MAKSITITIDMSGNSRDSHGDVESHPKVSINAHGLDTQNESILLGNIHSALIGLLSPTPAEA